MSIQFQTPTGINGCWASNMINNTFTIENDHSFAYDIVEARLYRLDNNNNPSQLVESWSNISTTNAHIDGYPIDTGIDKRLVIGKPFHSFL